VTEAPETFFNWCPNRFVLCPRCQKFGGHVPPASSMMPAPMTILHDINVDLYTWYCGS